MSASRFDSSETSLAGRAAVWVATGLGVGMVAPAPGTIGGLWGAPLALAVGKLSDPWVQAGTVAALALAAVLVCDKAARALGASGDPQAVALDEIVALPIVFLAAPPLTWQLLVVGFVLFRLFDVWKPGLVREAEKLPGGWGIVADDVVAAILAWASLQGALWLERALGVAWLTA